MSFSAERLSLAQKRRRLTGKGLAEAAGVSSVTISRIKNGENDPDESTVERLASALNYPVSYFSLDDPDKLDTEAVSFRSLSKMSAKERDAAIGAGRHGLELSDWLEKEFSLPEANLIDLSCEANPESAARALRAYWGIGEKPIGNMLGLLEVHGVRVFSLAEATKHVDAFSFWRNERPFVFLNNFKSAEHSIYDSCHELGHLVIHHHAGSKLSKIAEREANQFASAFLMPEDDLRSRMPNFITVDFIIKAKARWRVSAMAMAYRLRALNLLTEWQYKSACIELGRRGYRSGEPIGVERETSAIWRKVLAHLWKERITKKEIAQAIHLPEDELENLIWGLAGKMEHPERGAGLSQIRVV